MEKLLTLLSQEAYLKVLSEFPHPPTTRNIYYFDTPAFLLKKRGFSVKVEYTQEDGYKLKVKQHGTNDHLLLEKIKENNFKQLGSMQTSFLKPLQEFLDTERAKPLMRLGCMIVTSTTKEAPEANGRWLVHHNLYPSGHQEKVLGLSYDTSKHDIATSLFQERLRSLGLIEKSVEVSRRDLFLR